MISDTALNPIKCCDAVLSFREHGIKRAEFRIYHIDPYTIYVAVPRRYRTLAIRLLAGSLPGCGLVVTYLSWWKCRLTKYKIKVLGNGPRNESETVTHIERSVKG